ncbi:MAG: autotransporter outer membrane beta-barrel domain-containing protein [Luteibacter sp.]|uniref:autotransporter family protein n=1 Tax=Luteibacter sp. TaxID=1886636 RepID=UPI0028068E77|nr:autotransporter outer membrane beta-barrel domain-containing protein [Luteibacter sp.]MDQ7997864.1 autotransporter outer membrane beta-barrel domain-containing protein [Luteibacter sp.]MDQ8050393.1 autotransporter outer membrane beta-barrel domain-containing protein [Luteibacter sp.]
MSTPHIPHPRRRSPMRRRYLTALVAAFLPPVAGAETPLFLAGADKNLDVPDGTYETRAASSYVLQVEKKGAAHVGHATFDTFGFQSHAVFITDNRSELTIEGGTLHTRGNLAYGIRARDTGIAANVTLTGTTIITEGAGALGAAFEGNAGGVLTGGSITTGGDTAIGIRGIEGGNVSVKGTTITTRGKTAHALYVDGSTPDRATASALQATETTVRTDGDDSTGVHVMLGATASLTDVNISTGGESAHALDANTLHGQITIQGGEWHTRGDEADGLYVLDGQRIVAARTNVTTTGKNAIGIDNRASSVGLDSVSITTAGESAFGLNVQGGDFNASPGLDAADTKILTTGTKAHGAVARGDGRIDFTGSSIETEGDDAHGLVVNDADVRARNTNIVTHGAGAFGARVVRGGALDMKGGSLISDKASALSLSDSGRLRFDGTVIRGGNGVFVDLTPESEQPITVTLQNAATADGIIRRIPADGDAVPDNTKLSLDITSGARWTGATSIVRDLSLQSGGTWNVTADSRVDHLSNHAGVVTFAPERPDAFATLTISGDYDGKDGVFRMRARLGDDSSPADRIHVLGNTSGTSGIAVDTLGSQGDVTQEGIQLVRVDGRSDGVFALLGRAVAGPYEYFLHKGSLKNPSDGGWYLRSSITDPVVDPVVVPGDPDTDPVTENPDVPAVVDPPLPPPPVLRPEVGAYRANQTAALEMFQGGPGGGEDDEREGVRQSVWARFDRRHTAFNIGDELTTTASTSELTLGADLLRSDSSSEGYLGVMAAAGSADTRATSALTHYSAKGRVRGTAAGVYGGVRLDDGSYVRGWAQYAHFNQRLEGDALADERYGSGALSASLEAGRRWRLALNRDTDVYLEPQAQVLATRLRGGSLTEANGTRVTPLHASGATGRLGLRGAARWHTPSGHTASPYFSASWLRRLGRLDATQIGMDTFNAGVPRNAYALKLGLTLLRANGWRAWSDVETRFGTHGYRRVTGSLGIRRAW